jgi:hypothetical protein
MIKLSPSAYVQAQQVEAIMVDPGDGTASPEIVLLTISGKEFRLPATNQADAENCASRLATEVLELLP